jgi:hypothetical protein
MTQDQSALILEHSVAIFAPGEYKVPVYNNNIRVVSRPFEEEDPTNGWLAIEGCRMTLNDADTVRLSRECKVEYPAMEPASNRGATRHGTSLMLEHVVLTFSGAGNIFGTASPRRWLHVLIAVISRHDVERPEDTKIPLEHCIFVDALGGVGK